VSQNEYPALTHFFDCYLHQGAMLCVETPAEVAREFAESEDPELVAAARVEIAAMLALPEVELRRSRYLPVYWEFGDGTRTFLIELQQAWNEPAAGNASSRGPGSAL
jgi:hypothetical protein